MVGGGSEGYLMNLLESEIRGGSERVKKEGKGYRLRGPDCFPKVPEL